MVNVKELIRKCIVGFDLESKQELLEELEHFEGEWVKFFKTSEGYWDKRLIDIISLRIAEEDIVKAMRVMIRNRASMRRIILDIKEKRSKRAKDPWAWRKELDKQYSEVCAVGNESVYGGYYG